MFLIKCRAWLLSWVGWCDVFDQVQSVVIELGRLV